MTKHEIDQKQVAGILEKYPAGDSGGLIHALQEIQAAFNYIPVEAVDALCRHLDIPLSKAFSAATFYKAFSLDPKGDIIIRVCTGTACHIRGAQVLVEELVDSLNIKPGETTDDLKFTVETVNCVGACALGPLVILDGEYHGNIKSNKLEKVLKKLEKDRGE